MGRVILEGSAEMSVSALVVLLHDHARREPERAPADITREGRLVRLAFDVETEEPATVQLHLSPSGSRTVAVLESCGNAAADREARDLVREVLHEARGIVVETETPGPG
jgi:hypothetical protein